MRTGEETLSENYWQKKTKLHSFLFNCERWACNFASSLPWLCGRWQLHERQKRCSPCVCVCDTLNWKLCTHTWPIPHSISLSFSLFHLRCLSAAVALCLNCRSYLWDTRATLRFATLWLCQWRQQKFRSLLLLNNSALILLFLNRLLIKLKVTTCRVWKGKMLQSQKANWRKATKKVRHKSWVCQQQQQSAGPKVSVLICCILYHICTFMVCMPYMPICLSGSIITVAFYDRERERESIWKQRLLKLIKNFRTACKFFQLRFLLLHEFFYIFLR